jgi:hypothetical protein
MLKRAMQTNDHRKEDEMPPKKTELMVFGPYLIPFDGLGTGTSKHITKQHVKDFWEQADVSKLSMKQGCYVFALQVSKGFTPWYVGQASKTFKQEALHPTKVNQYNEVIFKGNKGKPVMFFVGKPAHLRKVPRKQITDLETYLIQSAYYKNPALKNKQHASAPNWGIKGVVRGGKGKPASNARRFKLMLGL